MNALSDCLNSIDGSQESSGEPKVQDLVIDLNTNTLEVSRLELHALVVKVFHDLEIVSFLGLSEVALNRLIDDIEASYLDNPYHSFRHAVDVTCVLYDMLWRLGAKRYLRITDVTAAIIGALCHDIGHDGYNNLFHVNSKSEVAALYNNISVLENQSCALTMDLLDIHPILEGIHLSNAGATEEDIRETICEMILATDMSFHFELQDKISDYVRTFGSISTYVSAETIPLDIRQGFLNILLHASDISNTVRPWKLNKCWSDLICQEFWRQGDTEKALGLPLSPNMDRMASHQPDISLKFVSFIVKPFFEGLAQLWDGASVFVVELDRNMEQWAKVQASIQVKPPAAIERTFTYENPPPQAPGSSPNLPRKPALDARATIAAVPKMTRTFSVAAGLIDMNHPKVAFRPEGMKRTFSSSRRPSAASSRVSKSSGNSRLSVEAGPVTAAGEMEPKMKLRVPGHSRSSSREPDPLSPPSSPNSSYGSDDVQYPTKRASSVGSIPVNLYARRPLNPITDLGKSSSIAFHLSSHELCNRRPSCPSPLAYSHSPLPRIQPISINDKEPFFVTEIEYPTTVNVSGCSLIPPDQVVEPEPPTKTSWWFSILSFFQGYIMAVVHWMAELVHKRRM